ncbi:hypothetical protein P872_16370 [Rhodonellum psychrophilum GCM71 = DSM 17998]|uniref:Uncharacterized protein n=1 Tax=Rhodonellum psychrophilum GCM71 = DSM 17998 TaxID=1123057 RepID=U5C4W5_9BACT|nr:hypothetical protein P872_16370 [Rhodonellum psychrophilum GCM71 = DSM 17998]
MLLDTIPEKPCLVGCNKRKMKIIKKKRNSMLLAVGVGLGNLTEQ